MGSRSKKSCCVPNCGDLYSKKHRFPVDPVLFAVWIKIINNPKLLVLSPEQVHKSFLVCDNHFTTDCKVPGTRRGLKSTAVPTLLLSQGDGHNLWANDDDLSVAGPSKRQKVSHTKEECFSFSTDYHDFFPSEELSCLEVPESFVVDQNLILNFSEEIVCETHMDTDDAAALRIFDACISEQPLGDENNSTEDSHPSEGSGTNSYPTFTQHMEHDYFAVENLSVSKVHGADVLSFSGEMSREEYANADSPTPSKQIPNTNGNKSPCKFVALPKGVKRNKILGAVNVTRKNQLTPKAKHFYKNILQYARKVSSLHKKINNYQLRLVEAEKLNNSESFMNLLKYVNTTTYKFILSQVSNQNKPKHGRRFSIDEKIFALTLMKSSGRGYRLLSKIFALPSKRTLLNLLSKINLLPGLNKRLFHILEEKVSNMATHDKCCILIFDEMKIDVSIQYDRKNDVIVGLEDFGDERNPRLADYANVFFLKGVRKQWKQPIAFTFSSGGTKAEKWKSLIKQIIRECINIGLDVVATICDQGSSNQAAINLLLNETKETFVKKNEENRHHGFIVDGTEVIPLYDPPHLIKGIRNNLLTKDLHFTINGKNMVAKWDHIIQLFYYLDTCDDTRMCTKLTDGHVLPEKINKMNVSTCTQVFSNQVGSLMKRISQWDIDSEYKLERDASATAEFILFMDKLFDSLNGSAKVAPSSKPLKGGVSKTSSHKEFWQQSICLLQTMKFHDTRKGFVYNPSLKNLIFTLKGLIYLSERLLVENKFSYFTPRTFNQDCVENFFAMIRSHGVRNISPTASHFIASFKALIVNNFMSTHSPHANCEADFSAGALDDLRCLLTGEEVAGVQPLQVTDGDINLDLPLARFKKSRVTQCTIKYIAGYLAKKILRKIKDCKSCTSNLLFCDREENIDFIEARQYEQSKLVRPGSFISIVTSQALGYLFFVIPRVCHIYQLRQKLMNFIRRNINLTPLDCKQHNVSNIFVSQIVFCIIFFWCKRVNQIAKGKDDKFVKLYRKNPNVDKIKLQAYQKFQKRCPKKKRN